jgi:hypothetical protein
MYRRQKMWMPTNERVAVPYRQYSISSAKKYHTSVFSSELGGMDSFFFFAWLEGCTRVVQCDVTYQMETKHQTTTESQGV